jgi:hypothetical protein
MAVEISAAEATAATEKANTNVKASTKSFFIDNIPPNNFGILDS